MTAKALILKKFNQANFYSIVSDLIFGNIGNYFR